jgi:hypothetical protein
MRERRDFFERRSPETESQDDFPLLWDGYWLWSLSGCLQAKILPDEHELQKLLLVRNSIFLPQAQRVKYGKWSIFFKFSTSPDLR